LSSVCFLGSEAAEVRNPKSWSRKNAEEPFPPPIGPRRRLPAPRMPSAKIMSRLLHPPRNEAEAAAIQASAHLRRTGRESVVQTGRSRGADPQRGLR